MTNVFHKQIYPFDVGRIVGKLIEIVDLHDGVVGGHHVAVVHGRSEAKYQLNQYKCF
jgi:hypothetical protein